MIVQLQKQVPPTPVNNLPAGEDRRDATRWGLTTLAALAPLDAAGIKPDDAQTFQAFVLNVSLKGIGLRCPTPLPVGKAYQIDIGAGPLKLHSRMRVANCRPRKDGTFDVGGAFF